MAFKSSPTTSDNASVIVVPTQAAANRPPLTLDRCRRTVFSAWMSAPAFIISRVVATLSASVMPSTGEAINADAPPDNKMSRTSPEWTDSAIARAFRPAASLRASGNGWLDSIHSTPSGSA